MNVIDDELRALHIQCGPYLARLAVLAGGTRGTPLPAGAAAEVAAAVGGVVAQAEAAGRAVVSAAAEKQQAATGEFLTARLARLKSAADDVVTAARDGQDAALCSRLRHFGTLTAALWAVHQAVTIRAPALP